MRIGVDATAWRNRRGYGRYLRALLATTVELDSTNDYTFFVDTGDAEPSLPSGVEVAVVQTSLPTVVAAGGDRRRRMLDIWAMSRALSRPDLECILFPTVYSYLPVFSRAFKIVVIHDVIPEKLPSYVFRTVSGRFWWTVKSLVARRQADLIVTVSEFARRGILEHFGEPADRVKVIGEAADPIFRVSENPAPTAALSALGITPGLRYLTYVGGFSPHKNLLALIDAFSDLATNPDSAGQFDDVHLVLVGDFEKDSFTTCYHEVRQRTAEHGLSGRVIFAGFLPDPDLVALLNLATALVLPSLMEGFGLPGVEAAACGLPVIATTSSPLPDLLGDAALYVGPQDTAALRAALVRVLNDDALRLRMREQGLRAASSLTWNRAASDLLAIFGEVADHHAKAA